MSTQEQKRAMATSIILGLAAILSVAILVYALQQKSRADQLQIEVDSLKLEMKTMKSVGDSVHVK